MREILFRGKRVDNGKWVEGYYGVKGQGTDAEEHFIIKSKIMTTNSLKSQFAEVKVDPETVGQFTGIVDKNGKKIFEGDIIESPAYMRYVIKYDIEYAMFAKYIVSRPTHFEGRLVNINAMTEVFEIIGDIYNNPELLKEVSRDIINETVQRCLAPATENFELWLKL